MCGGSHGNSTKPVISKVWIWDFQHRNGVTVHNSDSAPSSKLEFGSLHCKRSPGDPDARQGFPTAFNQISWRLDLFVGLETSLCPGVGQVWDALAWLGCAASAVTPGCWPGPG